MRILDGGIFTGSAPETPAPDPKVLSINLEVEFDDDDDDDLSDEEPCDPGEST